MKILIAQNNFSHANKVRFSNPLPGKPAQNIKIWITYNKYAEYYVISTHFLLLKNRISKKQNKKEEFKSKTSSVKHKSNMKVVLNLVLFFIPHS